MKYTALFEKGQIGRMEVKNRLVMPPMVRNYADPEGKVTDRYVAHIERIARGGVGTLILEASYIERTGKGFMNQLGIHEDACIPGLRRLVDAAHTHGAKVGIQLYHAGRQTSSKITQFPILAPSAIPDPTTNEMPHALTHSEIVRLIGRYAEAALRAKRAGMDFVEIHGAHGYLITQFLSPFSNKRTDAYGGTPEKRFTFLREVFVKTRKAVGKDMPIFVRLSGDELVPDGITIEASVGIAKHLETLGADALHISAGNYASYARGKMIPPMAMQDGVLVPLASEIRHAVSIPVIAVAKIRKPDMAERIIRNGDADFVAIGRTLLADPDWPIKVQEHRLDEINPCIACNQGCIGRLFEQKDVWCTVNPEASRELEFAKAPGKRKRVVVVGGGPAGMQAAKTAAARGHEVVLFEKSSRLGGQLFAAGAAPYREGWNELRATLVADMKRLGIDVRLKQSFGLRSASSLKPDAVIVAIGSSATVPKIPGIKRTNVVIARDLLEGRVKAKGSVVVVGGGCAGAQTAEFLADQRRKVTIVESSPAIAVDAPSDDRALLLGRLAKKGVTVLTEHKVMAIGEAHVTVESHKGVASLHADTVVLCLGSYPNDGLAEELKSVVKKVLVVGDAKSPRRVTEAMSEGALAALEV